MTRSAMTSKPRRALLFAPLLALALGACAGKNTAPVATPEPAPLPTVAVAQPVATPAPPEDPKLLSLASALARSAVPTAGGELFARVRIDAARIKGGDRPPVTLSLVIDTSSSMEGEGIEGARAAAVALVDSLTDGDRLGVVTFGSRAEAVVPVTVISDKTRADIRALVQAIKPSGTTNLQQGLSAGITQVQQNIAPSGINRVVLLSDGVPNQGAQLVPLAQGARSHGISITALGLGLEFDETLLVQLAQHSGGRFHYIEESTAVASVFEDEVLRIKRAVARNIQLQLTPGPGVTVKEVVGMPTQAVQGGFNVGLGDLSEGEVHDVMVRLQVGAHTAGATVELLDTRVLFDDVVANSGRHDRTAFVAAKATDDKEALAAAVDPQIDARVEEVVAADAMVRFVGLGRSGQEKAAWTLLDAAETRLAAAIKAYDDGAGPLAQLASDMKELRGEWVPIFKAQAEARKRAEAEARKRALAHKRALKKNKNHPGHSGVVSLDDVPQPQPMAAPTMSREVRRTHARAVKALQPHS